MDTILNHSFIRKKLYDRISVRTLLLASIFAIITVLTLVASAYFSLRAAIIAQKEYELFSVATELAEDERYKNSTLALFNNSPSLKRRVLAVDSDFRITYDSSELNNLTGKVFFHPVAKTALREKNFFECKFFSDSIESHMAIPVKKDRKVSEILVILESDSSYNSLLDAVRITFTCSSLIAVILFISLAIFSSTLLKRRLSSLLTSIKSSRTEFSAEKLSLSVNDETEPLVEEFNSIYDQVNYVQQMRKAFVSDASHELRTPLAAIKLLCESISGTENIDPETTQEFMGDILLEIDRMSHTADKLLVLSRLDSSEGSPLAPVHLTDIVRRTTTALSPLAEDKKLTVESYLEENCTILADMEGATQIVSNLIDNAIKYNHTGGCLRIYLYSKNGSCVFITDDTGIGLAIVKQNILRFSGTIEISDSVFGGTRFTVTLPKLVSSEEETQ